MNKRDIVGKRKLSSLRIVLSSCWNNNYFIEACYTLQRKENNAKQKFDGSDFINFTMLQDLLERKTVLSKSVGFPIGAATIQRTR